MENKKSNRRVLFLIILVGLVSTILSPLGDILAEGLVEKLKNLFGENYKLPIIILSISLSAILFVISEGGLNFERSKKEEDLVKNTSRIFIFGKPNVGKSFLVNGLINYMIDVGELEPTVEDKLTLHDKIEEIKGKLVPYRTPIGEIQKFNVLLKPHKKQ